MTRFATASSTFRLRWQTAPAVFVTLIVALLFGCNRDGKVAVSGTITFEGEPIATGHIIFTPVDPSIGPDADKIVDGRFSFRASPGEKRVEVFADRPVGEPDPVMKLQRKEQYIPTRYNEETELVAQVSDSGGNEFAFELVAKAGDRKAGDLGSVGNAAP